MKGPTGTSVGGIYCNPRFIHAAASLVGCVVHVQVRDGTMYEGVFHTFSQKVEVVLRMALKVDKKSNTLAPMLSSRLDPSIFTETMIFKIADVIALSVLNVDMDYATRDSFTDTAISRFNGQVQERALEPWDGGISSSDNLTDLSTDEVSNGWAADDMFRTNEVKYGVKSSFDGDLHDYTIPLKKQNTEEYKLQEAKACKIAQEIENSFHYKNRIALENGDEEERFSAVVRADNTTANNSNGNNNNNNRFVPHRSRKPPGVRPVRSSPSPNAHPNNRMPPHTQNYHNKPSSQNPQSVVTQAKNSAKPGGVSLPLSKPVAHPLPPRQGSSPQGQSGSPGTTNGTQLITSPSPTQNSNASASNSVGQSSKDNKVNGDVPRALKEPSTKDINITDAVELQKENDRPKEMPEKKTGGKKVHDDKTEDLKRFHEKFKLPESKEKDKDSQAAPALKSPSTNVTESVPDSVQNHEKKVKDGGMSDHGEEMDNVNEDMKISSLNPNAKEFVLNPNAKSFTPRALPLPAGILPPPPPPPAVQPPPRLHAQSPVIAVPQAHLMPGMPHPVFNVAPHYVLPATPVSVPIAPPYTPATSMAQAPRYRKAMPMSLPRNDSSQSIHVQAATGQPILAPPSLSTPQFAIQYTPSPGILHPTGPPQHQLAYTQMYSMVGQRVITPQSLGMVSASASYGENPHVPTQIYMNPQAVANVGHPGPSANSGQHSTPSTPQSQTPNLHTAPSPVHQAPPPPVTHGQAPTPTGHPSNPPTPQLVYHSQLTTQHPLHINPGSSNHNHPYPTMYGTGPQPIMLLPQQAMPGPHHPAAFSTIQNHFHAQAPGAHGTPTQIIPHPPVAMMPTSTAMAHGQVSVSNNHHYVPHSQV